MYQLTVGVRQKDDPCTEGNRMPPERPLTFIFCERLLELNTVYSHTVIH